MAQASFVNHPSFTTLKPWLEAQVYGRDGGPGKAKQRRRIELKRSSPRHIVLMALNVTTPCPACGAKMQPFRFRKPASRAGDVPQHIYFAATCPERPTERQLLNWRRLLLNPAASRAELRKALRQAVNANKTCCKGAASTQEYKAVIAAVEGP